MWKGEGFTRTWPKEIDMGEAVKRRIDLLWSKLGL
jgi:3-polyprenyl-4-hydroxybenzoate decarboxylase